MENYKSFYPTLRQAKTKWSKPSIVAKQGEGPSHDWYDMMKKDARAKLAASIHTSKMGSTSHQQKIVREGVVPFAKKDGMPVLPTTYVSDPEHIKKAKSKIWDKNYTDWKARKKAERVKSNSLDTPDHDWKAGHVKEDKLGKQTPSAEEIAKKHKISVDQVNAQIKKGIEVEKEHTDDEGMAHEIARDHLGEFPDYYDRLGAMEKAAKKKKMNEAAGEGNPSNNKGVLHELLVGYHMRGGSHMEKHKDVHGDSPKQAHDKIKAITPPDEYKKINHRAKAAAADISAKVAKHGKIHDVHWTSKPGDIHRSTGIHASQKEDPSDIVIHTKKGSKITHHGVSLKVTDNKAGHVPVSNPGMESTYGGQRHLDAHRKAIIAKHPKLAKMTNSAARKEYIRANPKVKESIHAMHSQVLPKIAKHLTGKLAAMDTKDLADHLRKHILKATPTPMQKQGHTHLRHTTHGADGNYSFSHLDPSTSHEHILKDHKNITVHHSGTSVIFSHKGTPFARHRLKLQSQSDPMSTVKGSGELIGKHAIKEGYDAQREVDAYNKSFDDQKELERNQKTLKDYLKKKYTNAGRRAQKTSERKAWAAGKMKEGYDPEVEQVRNRIDAHQKIAAKMAKEHGEQSQEAAFHRAYVKHMQRQLKDQGVEEGYLPVTKRRWRGRLGKIDQSQLKQELPPKTPHPVPKGFKRVKDGSFNVLKKIDEEVPNSVGGGMSPVIGGEGNIHGFDPIMGKPVRRKRFAGKQVFVVDPTTYHKAYLGKRKYEHYDKYLEGSPFAEEIRAYGRKYWDEPIVLENEQTGAMVYLKYGSK